MTDTLFGSGEQNKPTHLVMVCGQSLVITLPTHTNTHTNKKYTASSRLVGTLTARSEKTMNWAFVRPATPFLMAFQLGINSTVLSPAQSNGVTN